MRNRGKLVFVCLTSLATACTAILGVEDVPNPAGATTTLPDGGGVGSEGGVVGAEGGTDTGLAAAILAYASAYCQRFQGCFPKVFPSDFASVAECTAQVSANALAVTTLPGFASTAADLQGCATRASALTCANFAGGDAQFVCSLKGTKQLNDLCADNSQCASGVCDSNPTSCRGCVTPPTAGQPCTKNLQCSPGLVCTTANTCEALVDVGGSCATAPCNFGLSCVNDVCTEPVDTVGAACDGGVGCNSFDGLFCIVPTGQAAGQCVSVAYDLPGQRCGANTTTSFTECLRGYCNLSTDICPQVPKPGDPCDNGTTVLCPTGYACINGTCSNTVQLQSSSCK